MASRRNTSANPVLAYAKAVASGREVAGPYVRSACERHLRDLKRKDIRWDLKAARRALEFFPDVLRLSEGQFDGIPFDLHPSQAFIVGSIFGWKRKDGPRRFRRAYVEQGKGNGKSPLAGGIGLYCMMADSEAGAEIYAAAAKRDQAMILFGDAVKMVRQSSDLDERLTKSGVNPVLNLADLNTGSFFRPLSRESGKTGSGPRPHCALVDELHEHPDRTVLETLERGFKFRRNPLLFMITNSGSDRESVCFEEHEHAIKVSLGDVDDDETFAYVCALDEGDDPLTDPSCWRKANPLLGVTITEEYLAGVAKQAQQIPGKQNGILRLHFCTWTDSESAWIARDVWEACEDPELDIDDFAGARCWIGLDLGAVKDLTGKVYLFDDGITEDGRPKFAMFARGYTPRDSLEERALKDRADYPTWVRRGWLTATPGKIIRIGKVAEDLAADRSDYDLVAISYDRYLYRDLESEIDEVGIDLPLVEHPQGFSRRKDTDLWMPGSITELESLILDGRLRVEVNFALRSAVANATFERSMSDLRRFTKQRARGRIDLIVAAAMAVGAAESFAPKSKESVYETRGVLVI